MEVLIAICKELDINLNSLMTGELSKATATEKIPTSTRDVLLAVTTLIKADCLKFDEHEGWYFSPTSNTIYKFANEIDNFTHSKYKKIDSILLDLIDTYKEEIEKEYKNADDYYRDHPDELPF